MQTARQSVYYYLAGSYCLTRGQAFRRDDMDYFVGLARGAMARIPEAPRLQDNQFAWRKGVPTVGAQRMGSDDKAMVERGGTELEAYFFVFEAPPPPLPDIHVSVGKAFMAGPVMVAEQPTLVREQAIQ